MKQQFIRPAAVAGTWYPNAPAVLASEVDRYLAAVDEIPRGEIVALIAPHAGLIYSGPVAAYAYQAARQAAVDVAMLVGPSHFVGFDGIALYERGAFETPLGAVPIAEAEAQALLAASPEIRPLPAAHAREHSLEMQLPFLRRVLPEVPIVPMLMGYQTRETVLGLAGALASVCSGRRALLIASTDLSHYFDAETATKLDQRVIALVGALDDDGLLAELELYPEYERGRYVACGGGPAVSVLRAARALGASEARILRYADSGDVSGDKRAVVGYLAAAIGRFH